MSVAYDIGTASRSNLSARPHGNTDWPPEHKEEVRRLWTEEKWSLGLIGDRFGRTRNAVAGLISRMGLKGMGGSQPKKPNTQRKRVYNNERRTELRMLRVAAGRTKFANRLSPDALPEAPQDDPSLGISLLDLKPNACRWVCDADHVPKLYCGQDASVGSAYCVFHHVIVYRPRT